MLTLLCIKKDNNIGVTAFVEEEPPHGAILMLGGEDFGNLHYRTIQSEVIITRGVIPRRETNSALIRSVFIHRVACEFVAHKGAQTEVDANTQTSRLRTKLFPQPKG